MQKVLLVMPYFDRFAVRRYDTHASDLRREESAIATECRSDASSRNCAADGATHQVVTAGKFETVFSEFADKIADAHAGLHGNSVTVCIYVFDLIQAGQIDDGASAGRCAFRGRTSSAHWAKRRQISGIRIQCVADSCSADRSDDSGAGLFMQAKTA